MNHIEEHITGYIHGEFSEEVRRTISDHLIDCVDCQKVYKELLQTQQSINLIEEIEPSRDFVAITQSRVELIKSAENQVDWILEELNEMDLSQEKSSQASWVMVASTFLILGAFFMFSELNPENSLPPEQPENMAHFLPAQEVIEGHEKDMPLPPEPLSAAALADLLKELDIEVPIPKPVFNESVEKENRPEIEVFPREPKEPVTLPLPPIRKQPLKELVKIKTPAGLKPPVEPVLIVPEVKEPKTLKEKPEVYWLYNRVNHDGSVGDGRRYHKILNSSMSSVVLHRRLRDLDVKRPGYKISNVRQLELKLIRKKLKITNQYLLNLNSEKGLGKNIHEHAQITYFLCLMMGEGQTMLQSQVEEALSFLVQQQNKDGGWDFVFRLSKNQPFTSSNTLATGWAVMALNEAKGLKLKKSRLQKKVSSSIYKSQEFFKRMTDPRNGQCGFKMRGDGKHRPLCSVMATLARLSYKKASRLKNSIKVTKEWVNSGLHEQIHSYPRQIDYDFIFLTRLFSVAVDEEKSWDSNTEKLLGQLNERLPKSQWGQLPKTSRQLFLELLKK